MERTRNLKVKRNGNSQVKGIDKSSKGGSPTKNSSQKGAVNTDIKADEASKVDIASAANINELVDLIKQMPVEDADKVSAIKERVQNGSYTFDTQETARRIITEAIMMENRD